MDMLSHMTDDELVKSYADGCNEAFDELLTRYKDTLYDYISFQLNNQPEDIDDVFQETFVKVIVSLKEGRYISAGHFGAWLTRIAHNIIVDQFRADSQLTVVSSDRTDCDLLNDTHVVDTYAEARIVNEQTLADVRLLMEQLPEEQRSVVYMRYYENLSFKEIADIMHVSVNTCLGRARYGLMNMRRMAAEHHVSLEWI